MFGKHMFCRSYDAILFKISYQTFPTSRSLNKDKWTKYLIITTYVLNIDKVYRFPIIHTKKNLRKGYVIQKFLNFFFVDVKLSRYLL